MTDVEYIASLEKENMKEKVDSFNVGDTVRVLSKVKEGNRERTQAFEGVVAARSSHTFVREPVRLPRLRKFFADSNDANDAHSDSGCAFFVD